ncbi:MAG TPA: cadherin-like domain-containing protein, partial [Acidimicrobiia bacterium]
DNLVFDDQKAVDPVDPVDPVPPVDPTGDGIVSGDDTDNTIDLAYTGDPEGDRVDAGDAVLPGEAPDDDIIDAKCGDDTILAGAGDDDIYAGGGDDVVSGGAGNDLIFGDSTLASAARESFNWSEAGFGPDETLTGFTQNTGTVKVTYSNVKPSSNFATSFSDEEQNTSNVDGGTETVSSTSSLSSVGFVSDQQTRYALGFNTPVSNVEFNINDIDGDSVVRVQAFDAAGAPVDVMLVGGDRLTLLDTDGVPGADTADSNGGYADAPNPAYSLNVSIAGPVSRVEITHEQDGPDNTSVNITDVFFTPGEAGAVCEDGNDSLSGDEGDDTIFGEGGNDTIFGGAGADSLFGGDDADLFIGGNAGDVVDGGSGGDDRDTLDLSDSGPLRVVDETLDADGNSTSGTIEFLNADGTVSGSMTFTEIETLILPEDPVDPENFAPVATDDTAVTDEETLVNIAVLENDTDPEGDPLTITEATSDDGTVVILPDGTLDFTPNPDFFGEAVIDYTITDGNGGFDDSRVFVTVNNVNDAPVANDDTAITGVGESVTIPVLANDTDADNDPLTVTEATSPDGDVVINPDGTVTFTPTPGFIGDAIIDYAIDDGNGGTDTAQVSVSVGETSGPPVAVDDTAVTDEDTAVTIPVLANDTDPDGDPLTVTGASSPNGDVVINDNGTITFTPARDFNGEAVITYDITDGNGGVDTAEVVVTVNPVND